MQELRNKHSRQSYSVDKSPVEVRLPCKAEEAQHKQVSVDFVSSQTMSLVFLLPSVAAVDCVFNAYSLPF